jgi:hypothetical protein
MSGDGAGTGGGDALGLSRSRRAVRSRRKSAAAATTSAATTPPRRADVAASGGAVSKQADKSSVVTGPDGKE